MDQSIKAGIFGIAMAVVANLFLPIYLYFVPTFIVSILVIYFFGLRTLKDGLIAAFMTYTFSDGLLATLSLAVLYVMNEPYPQVTIDAWLILSPIVSAISAVVAAFIGVLLARQKKPIQEAQQQPIPQDLQSV